PSAILTSAARAARSGARTSTAATTTNRRSAPTPGRPADEGGGKRCWGDKGRATRRDWIDPRQVESTPTRRRLPSRSRTRANHDPAGSFSRAVTAFRYPADNVREVV